MSYRTLMRNDYTVEVKLSMDRVIWQFRVIGCRNCSQSNIVFTDRWVLPGIRFFTASPTVDPREFYEGYDVAGSSFDFC